MSLERLEKLLDAMEREIYNEGGSLKDTEDYELYDRYIALAEKVEGLKKAKESKPLSGPSRRV